MTADKTTSTASEARTTGRRELPKTYDPAAVEGPIYQRWLDRGVFHAVPRRDRKPYVVMMPLPNVTGALHMGHAMDNLMQDLLIRWHRMMGDDTLWMPGADHAGIATQAVVEKRLKELEGKTRHDLGREALVDRIWAWKDQYQTRIVSQQQRMGCSCDWDRHRFTMDPVCARAVRHTFFKMFTDGLIYRGKRLVNWDVFLQTSVSDDEVYHETVQGHFWHLRYPVVDPRPGEPTHVTVATTRPETMLGDTAVAVHPDPEGALTTLIAKAEEALAAASDKDREAAQAELDRLRRRKDEVLPTLITLRDMARDGRKLLLPLMDRPIPLIADAWAKPDKGSGAVKITPAHDPNDYEVWRRHAAHIDILNILRPDGHLNDAAGPYAGLERYEARERVVADLDAQGLLGEVEDREVEVGHSDRSKTPVEPYLSDQWFVRMGDVEGGVVMGRGTNKEHVSPGLVQAAMDAVTDGRVTIHPARYTKTYLDWLSEKRDWPVSRQLWWGHQIPVWSKSGRFEDLAPSELAGLFERLRARGEASEAQAVARLHRLDSGDAVALEDGVLPEVAIDPHEQCAVDVCLLSDDPELVAALEDLGYERDPDVLDTWFSSALWPFSTLGWPDPSTAPIGEGQAPLGPVTLPSGETLPDALSTYYPGSCLVTGRDIITLWVARMVLAGLYDLGDVPFSDVFIHANILDGKGERMSKSKGNGIDPVDIIEAYGTDAMRYVLADMQTGTQDIRLPVTAVCPRCEHHNDLTHTKTGKSIFIRICGACGGEFDVLGTMPDLPAGKLLSERFEIGRNFANKLWNSARFALMNLDVPRASLAGDVLPQTLALEDRWLLDRLTAAVRAVQEGLEEYNPSAAINAARDFFWGDLCDWYLEIIKPRLSDDAAQADPESARVARRVLAYGLDTTLRLLHPFMPFITEELWARLGEVLTDRGLGAWAPLPASELVITAAWPTPVEAMENPEAARVFRDLQDLTRAVREVRSSLRLSPRQPLDVVVKVTDQPDAPRATDLETYAYVVEHLARVTLTTDAHATRTPGSAARVVGELEIFVQDVIDDEAERERLEGQRKKLLKELGGLEKKLANPKFVERAPAAVVADQRARLEAAQASLAALERSLAELS